jgi:hypothetical protein
VKDLAASSFIDTARAGRLPGEAPMPIFVIVEILAVGSADSGSDCPFFSGFVGQTTLICGGLRIRLMQSNEDKIMKERRLSVAEISCRGHALDSPAYNATQIAVCFNTTS